MTGLEQELINQLLSGDEQAFESVFVEYYAAMHVVARAIVDETIADEVIQEAWVSAIRALPRFEGRSSLKSWLIRIVANEAKSRWRKESRSVSLDALQESWATDPRFDEKSHWIQPAAQWHSDTPEGLLLAEELQHCLEKNIEHLSENQRVALKLRGSSGLSMDEICNILKVSPSNLRVLLHRARDRVLKVIDHFQLTGEC